ncbi:MAG: ORF6N domain-containing protein [Elusimicrobiota bacterium]
MKNLMIAETIERRIYSIRGQKVMIDRDLAQLYGVATKALNQAVKRNQGRFPGGFVFRLTEKEIRELVTDCDQFGMLKHSSVAPLAFTDYGVAMLSSVLHSQRAIRVNINIMKTFVRLRQVTVASADWAKRFAAIERQLFDHSERFEQHAGQIKEVFDAIRNLMAGPGKPVVRIGFKAG